MAYAGMLRGKDASKAIRTMESSSFPSSGTPSMESYSARHSTSAIVVETSLPSLRRKIL